MSDFENDKKNKPASASSGTCTCNQVECICNHSGEVSSHEGSFTDNLLDGIVENVPNMIFLKRASDLRFEFMNSAGEKLLGIDRDELIGKNDYDFFPKDQADFFIGKDRKVLSQRDVIDIPEESIETRHGTRILHTQKISLCDEKGVPQYLLGISEDITKRKIAENKYQRFKETLDQAVDCVFMFDADNLLFTYTNEGAVQQVGYSHDELKGMHPYDIKPGYDEESFRELISPLIKEEEKTVNFETLHQHKNGEEIPVEILLQYIKQENERPHFVAFVRDITERKLMEQELDSYHSVLEAQVDQRTAELSAARDEAERANMAKSEFLSHMSHELRTPMNAILGFGQLLKMDADGFNETQRENIEEILDAGQHLMGLINEVLDLARIESGKIMVSMEKVNIDELIKQSLPMISNVSEEGQIDVVDNVSGKEFFVNADFGRLKQVLLNLLSNAVKYNQDHGCITLDADVVDGVDGGNNDTQYLRLSVSDTGQGLTKDQIEDLFVPFERLNASNRVEGTGIGLVITKQLIELMNGRAGVESTPGKGSTFWVELALSSS